MLATLHTEWTVGDIANGFVFDKNEGKALSAGVTSDFSDVLDGLNKKIETRVISTRVFFHA